MYDRLEKRGQSVINHIYVSPIIQKFTLDGRVTIGKLENREELQRRVNNAIYTWLNENADFAVNIQKSSIYDIIHNFGGVESSNIYFTAVTPDKLITTWADDPDIQAVHPLLNGATSATLTAAYDTRIQEFISSAGYAQISATTGETNLGINERTTDSLPAPTTGIWNSTFGHPWYFEDVGHERVGNVTERSFYTELMKNVYDDLIAVELTDGTLYVESQYFKNIMYKLNNDLKQVIRTSMLDSEGNITGYSFKNEISQVQINLNYIFAS
jgi:hypothetical protein